MQRSLGKITVTSAGTPQRITAGLTVPGNAVPIQSLLLQALPANTGIVYVFAGGNNFSGDHRTDLVRCVGLIAAPSDATKGPFPSLSISIPNVPGALNLADYWLDVGVSTDGVVVTYTAQ